MAKHIGQAIGDFNNPAIVMYSDNQGIRIKIDSNGNGRREDDSTDLWIAYRHENIGTTDSAIRYYPNAGTGALPAGAFETIANRVVLPMDGGLTILNLNPSENNIEVQIRCRWLPNQPASIKNPEVAMHAKINMPSVSAN